MGGDRRRPRCVPRATPRHTPDPGPPPLRHVALAWSLARPAGGATHGRRRVRRVAAGRRLDRAGGCSPRHLRRRARRRIAVDRQPVGRRNALDRAGARLGAHRVRRGRRLGTAVLAAPAGERHELPTAIVADLLRMEGLHVVDLGADTPADEVVGAVVAHDRVMGVGLCITTPLDDDARRRSVRADVMRVSRLVDCPVLVGGAAVPDRAAAEALGAANWSADAFAAVDWFLGRAGHRTSRDQEGDT